MRRPTLEAIDILAEDEFIYEYDGPVLEIVEDIAKTNNDAILVENSTPTPAVISLLSRFTQAFSNVKTAITPQEVFNQEVVNELIEYHDGYAELQP